ncbi:NAD-dependent epimerase/dehydratase family protein [Yoonia sp.]|uniref:NAD-dependent epimerase/dehydratase family protein n=1 Tax=Yoonia sp. TaxID=2212373 RepID=UPI003F6D4FDC
MTQSWHGKNIIVAGGAGFIGHQIVSTLLRAGASVHVIDNFSTGDPARLHALATETGHLTFDRHDITQRRTFPTTDVIFNLASPASPVHYQNDPLQTWKTNVIGTLHLLEHATACGATLVQASTSEVYGDPLSHPQKETDWGNVNPIGPRACYDESKRAAETLLMDAVRSADADIRIARIFNTYGPGMQLDDGRAIPNFIAQAQAGQPLTIHGNGSQTRSFCYVSDTVDGLLRLATMRPARGEVVNIGNPHEITIRQAATAINNAFGRPDHVVLRPRPVDDPSRRCPDITKAHRLLGWLPQVTFDAGLHLMAGARAVPITV